MLLNGFVLILQPVRIHIDSCDYSLDEYQAVADPIRDPELETFSISQDKKYIIPVVKEATRLSGNSISVLLSPWSLPSQWKTPPEMQANDAAVYGGYVNEIDFFKPNRCFGGRLKPEYYGSWAKYLVKYIQAYLEEGIPVTMHSESCGLHIPGKTMAFDIPKDAMETLPEEMKAAMKRTPLQVDFQDAKDYAHDLIGDINNGMNRWIDWNMIVDRTGGPRHVPGGFAAPLVAEEDNSFTKTISYHYICDIAKAVKPGVRRMGLSTCKKV